ncbi:Gfo/Idh/MocA family oxidoreductase [Thermomonas sp.]|uniref:Gfo/Idh/MocA family protein n=1 Tax=Thermomonas sp. TaxID=1971895 RepID=UPI0026034F4B|nr:Gfo/Idh/MocA family oxidoreductase [Thermomonas sp.]
MSLRLAIVGCGLMTQQTHMPAAARSKALEVTALVDPDLGRAQALAAEYAVARVGRSLADVAQAVDAVLVVTPPHVRLAVVAEAFAHGLHVLSEKPLANTVAECEALQELADRNPALVAAGAHVYRFWPARRWVHDGLRDGSLGRPLRAFVSQGNPYSWKSASGYSVLKELVPGGVLINAGIHPLDSLLWWFGDAESVEYADDAVGGLESNVDLRLGFPGGVRAHLRMSRTSRFRHVIEIETTTCRLELPTYSRHRIDVVGGDSRQTRVIGEDSEDALAPAIAQLEDFARAVETGSTPAVGFREATRAVRLVEACYRSKRARPLPALAPLPGEVW